MKNHWIGFSVLSFGLLMAAQCGSSVNAKAVEAHKSATAIADTSGGNLEKIVKTADEWRQILPAERFYVLREKGTERAFTGNLWNNHRKGTYKCAGCGLPLFSSQHKFESGTGWPSFFQPVKKQYVGMIVDKSHGMSRTEVVCNRCDGHLGHVFEDGPLPTGLRYCINSASLDFEEEK